MKREPTCRPCHYTSVLKDGDVTPQWGISCESCHGPASDWVNLHNHVKGDPAGGIVPYGTGKNETPQARTARLDAAAAKGMIHSRMLYEIAANCFGCHIVTNEDLVNRGGHLPGSDFDLVAWSQGQVRHNYVSSPGAPDAPANRTATPAELRRMYVTGAMADYELSYRALADAKKKDETYYGAMLDRVNAARRKVDALLAAAPIPEIASAMKMVPAVTADAAGAIKAADCLQEATKQFLDAHDGSDLASLDPLIPTVYKGRPAK